MAGGRETGRATLIRTAALGGRGLAVLLLATLGTNLIDFATAPAPGAAPTAAFLVALAIRVAVVFWASWALQRRLLAVPRPYRVTPALGRFALLQLAMLVPVVAATRLGKVMAGPAPSLAALWLAGFLALAFVTLALIRVLAWSAALAADARFAALPALWRAQAGRSGAVAYAYAVLVLPIAALHLALTLVALRLPGGGSGRLVLALIDGGVQAWRLLATLALSAVALEAAGGRSVEAARGAR